MIFTVPDDDIVYPSLGRQVVEWMQENLCHGPGDRLGEPLELSRELEALIWKVYEVYPVGHPKAGRRRFSRCAWMLAKGLAKTEVAALIAAAELHPDAPVRFNGWRGKNLLPGKGVTDPFITMVAFTEEQSDELAYGALRAILTESRVVDDFDIGLERIARRIGRGTAVSLAAAPNARDGARVTWSHFDETHWFTSPRLKSAHQVMLQNIPKRKLADAWSLETTTAFEPGAGSVAEATMDYAKAIADKRATEKGLFFFHLSAGDQHDLTTAEGARAAVIEASGSAAAWRNIDAVVDTWSDPTTDRAFWERVWCNRIVKGAAQAFDVEQWKQLVTEKNPVKDGDDITLGFDGALFHDAVALVATHIRTGYQWVAGVWEQPHGPAAETWKVPEEEVDAVVREMFKRYRVWRLYADPPYWQSWIAKWAGEFGADKVVEFFTNRRRQMAAALENFDTAIKSSGIAHDGDARLTRHIANARKHNLVERDEQGKALWLIRKERSDSPLKIDLAMAAVLSWEARTHAITEGVGKKKQSVYATRGVIVF